MTTQTARPRAASAQFRARLAGFLYLSLLPAPFGLVYVPARLTVAGNAAATANNIMASESLFRLGIVSILLVDTVNILLALALYQLLKPVSKPVAALMVLFASVGIAIGMLNELNQLAVLRLLSGSAYLSVFTKDQLQALALLFLNLHTQGLNIAQIFWGLWLFPMGYLVYKSGFIPKILGIFLIIGCFGYLFDSFAAFLLPGLKVNVIFFTAWGELLILLWLLIKGVDVEQWNKRALESAQV
jgi:uncharacterized protein (DUF486 family)